MSNRNFTIHSGERTATLNGPAIKATSETIALAFDVTAIDGTSATLNISVEWSPNGTNFGVAATPDTLPEITAIGVYQKRFDVKAKFYRVVFTVGGDISEIQAIDHNHTGGSLTLSFDGEGPTLALDWDAPVDSIAAEGELTIAVKPIAALEAQGTLTIDTKPIDAVAAQGKLTIGVEPSPGVKAQGTLTIAEPVTDGDQFTIDTQEYTLLDTPVAAYDIAIGNDEDATKVNIVAAINASGTPGTEYFAGTEIHPTVEATEFDADVMTMTAKEYGTDGNSIVTAETGQELTHVDNIFNTATLGTTATGVQPDSFTIGAQVYRMMEITEQAYDIAIGADEPASKVNIVAAINQTGVVGVNYHVGTLEHPTVSIAAFTVDDAILTADSKGIAGDAIVTTETFADGANIFDGTTLGVVTEGTADTVTIDGRTYMFLETLVDVDGNVAIGATLATAQANLVAAVNREAGYGTKYADVTGIHATVSIVDFENDIAVLTARTAGTAGNAIATTETFDEVTNIFDDTTLGTATEGLAGDTVTIDTEVYTFVDALTGAVNEVLIGASLETARAALVAAMASHATVAMAAFVDEGAILTAVELGTDGNAIATIETFENVANLFDNTTLGDETLGVNGVETELEKFSNISDVTVVRNGDGDWDVTFPSVDGDVALITIDDGNLTGGGTAAVVETVKGVDATVTFLGVATHFDANK